jgi:glycosyltransferase involved in cell wall biosynthesis
MAQGNRIRVTHVLTRPELGGAQANTLYTVRHLDRRRFQPALVTSPDGPLATEMASISDAEVTFVPDLVREIRPVKDWYAGRELVEHLRRTRPAIVHTHSSKAGILGRWAAHRAGVPVVVHTVHGFPFHDHQAAARRSLYRVLERATARLTDRFICVARADVEKGAANGVFRREDAVVIRSGIALRPFREAGGSGAGVRAELGIPAGVPLVGMVACLKPQKDPLAFVDVAARVRRAVPEAWFLLVGDGVLRARVEEARRRQGLVDRLLMLGWRRDIPAIMDALNVLVLTSLHEGLPRVVPEAMASSRPVVATAVDGTPEAVTDGVNGFLVPARDPSSAADRVVTLLSDPSLAAGMGEEGFRRVAEFDIEEMVRRQEVLYEELMKEHGAGRP